MIKCEIVEESKSINRKGAQALKNSPVGYFSEVARLQRWILRKVREVLIASYRDDL
jgi:hypothetical protein